LRQIGLVGTLVLVLSLIVSLANYVGMRGFEWTPTSTGFVYSLVLSLGFLISLGAGVFGAVKEINEFLIAAGAGCIALDLLNKLFANALYSWGYLDTVLLLAGVMMILDSFYVRRTKEERPEASKADAKPDELLATLDKLVSEADTSQPDAALTLEKEISDIKQQLWTESKKSPEMGRKLRIRLYHSRAVQEIVKRFIGSNLKVIEPALERSESPTYPALSDMNRYPQKTIQFTLNELVESGVLRRELYEKLVACPSCHHSSKVFARHKCPKCDSYNVSINRLMQHLECGAVYDHEEYHAPTGIICPKCGQAVDESTQLKPVGVSFKCGSCESISSDTNKAFFCRNCGIEFQLKNCELQDTYSYSLNNEVKSEAKETLTVLNIASTIEKIGYTVNAPGILKGKTGITHEFTLTCSKKDKIVAIELATAEESLEISRVLASYAKLSDITQASSLLIAIPKLEQQAKDFLYANRIQFIESDNMYEIADKTLQFLKQFD
jgi:Zn finger protein HypA/HybF involved in hydrogenase expression